MILKQNLDTLVPKDILVAVAVVVVVVVVVEVFQRFLLTSHLTISSAL